MGVMIGGGWETIDDRVYFEYGIMLLPHGWYDMQTCRNKICINVLWLLHGVNLSNNFLYFLFNNYKTYLSS